VETPAAYATCLMVARLFMFPEQNSGDINARESGSFPVTTKCINIAAKAGVIGEIKHLA
jgi:hypothetical protein